ncbi:MAG: DUF3078 domain-containing protein [Bacteroidales bacterium]|nr:DUF3078 domain-containing protein [Bacteroidales bacterium]
MKTITTSLILIACTLSTFAQDPPTDTLPSKEKPAAVWKTSSINTLNFSQMALSNWAAGGQGSLALNAYTDWSAKLSKGHHLWENRLQAAYGFVHAYDDVSKKSDDKLILDSKWGFQAFEKLYLSSAFNFTSQMTQGFEYLKNADPRRISNFMAPAYFSLGLGVDYKPFDFFSIRASPLTSKLVVVTDTLLRPRYGNKIDQKVRTELGAQIKMDFKKEIFTNVTLSTDLTLFSDYLGTPANVKVFWNFLINMKVNKYLSANFRTNMIYDDEIKITDKDGNVGPRLQIKEILGVGVTWSFGSK